jgi:sugar lactone lactonase YvrE
MAKQGKFVERFWKSSFPPLAVWGAFSSFVMAAFRSAPEPRAESPQNASLVQIAFSDPPNQSNLIKYSQILVLGAASSLHPFRRSLSSIAVDSADRIYALGDGEVRIFEPGGDLIRSWRAPDQALCLTVGPGGRVYFGLSGRIEIHDAAGTRMGGFAIGDAARPASVTAVKIHDQEILVADATARYIRRYDATGKQIGEIGTRGKTRSFMLPNRSLDMDVDSKGVVYATDSGRHRVTSWVLGGSPVGQFGKFGQVNPEDFVGCCNPVNLAIAPDGKVVTAEKVAARVKVYDPKGKLLALIGAEHFDPKCVHLHLAVDSKGRILVADPVRLEVRVFST